MTVSIEEAEAEETENRRRLVVTGVKTTVRGKD